MIWHLTVDNVEGRKSAPFMLKLSLMSFLLTLCTLFRLSGITVPLMLFLVLNVSEKLEFSLIRLMPLLKSDVKPRDNENYLYCFSKCLWALSIFSHNKFRYKVKCLDVRCMVFFCGTYYWVLVFGLFLSICLHLYLNTCFVASILPGLLARYLRGSFQQRLFCCSDFLHHTERCISTHS